MFGLMKPRGCGNGQGAESAAHRRLHYCGTCKTMGKLYGQRSRMLLNNDAVFLAELLTAIGPDQGSVKLWSRPLQSYNCASMPATEEDMPLALRFASASTLVMSEMKLKDHVSDTAGTRVRPGLSMVGRLYSEGFSTASRHLREWGVPMDALWSWYRAQEEREADVRLSRPVTNTMTATDTLSYLAEPTAEMTGLIFLYGAAAIGANKESQDKMRAVGRLFGSLIYQLDAFEDDRKDARTGEFNALHFAYKSTGEPMSTELRERATADLHESGLAVEAAIRSLPIPERATRMYAQRLAANVAHKLGLPVNSSCCSTRSKSDSVSRWSSARSTAARLTAQHRAECAGLVGAAKSPLIFGTVLLIALVVPRQAMSAASYQECMGALFNLMFWGAAFSAVLAMPQRLIPSWRVSGAVVNTMDGGIPHSSSGGSSHTTVVTTTRIRRRPCCCMGCECDCCCDGCCEACNCACCTCETCECASGCCDCASGCDGCSGC